MPTLDYLAQSADNERHFLLPCVVDAEHLVLRRYTGADDLEVTGRYHIPEPVGPLFDALETIDVAFIPGMAFDRNGHRLGRGKGYYDRLLSHPVFRRVPKIGVCFDFQMVDDVPVEDHDTPIDQLIIIPTS